MRKFLIRLFVSLAFLGLLFYMMREEAPQILANLKNADHGLMALATLIFLGTVIILAKRLQLIFAAEDVVMRLREATSLTFVGYFFNNFLPTAVGGDIVKAMCASRVTGQAVKSVTSVFLDRIFGLFTFVLIPSISLLFFLKQIDNPVVPLVIYSLLTLSLLSFLLLFNKKAAHRLDFLRRLIERFHWGNKVKQVYEGLHNFKRHKGVVAQAMLLSIFGQSVSIGVLYFMAVGLGSKPNILYFFMLIPVVQLLSMLPSINGLGVREWGYIYFLSPYIGKENSAALGILWLGLLFLLSLIGGVIYLVRHDYHIRFGPSGTVVS